MATIAENRKARYEYEILEEFEAGIALLGHEVKSARNGGMKLAGSHVTVAGGEARLIGAQIAPYAKAGTIKEYDPQRTRRLLLHKRELLRLAGKLIQKGLTLVPISAYTRGSRIKVKFALARGKKQYEKREQKRQKDIEREVRRSLKGE